MELSTIRARPPSHLLSNSNKTIRNTISVSLLSVRENTARDDSHPLVKLRRLQGDVKQSAMYRGIISARGFFQAPVTQANFNLPTRPNGQKKSIQPSQLPEREKMSSGLKNNPHFYEPMSSAAREYVMFVKGKTGPEQLKRYVYLSIFRYHYNFPPVWS